MSGDYFDYPIFVRAFEVIIESKVDSDKDKLYFLSKYTAGRAHDVIKGFVTLNSEDAYKEARKLLAQRFGDPFHVAEAYKAKLRKWPQIYEGDGAGVQLLSDYLIRCREAMRTMNCLAELDSTETLIQISAKLPSYSGVKWCRHAYQLRRKSRSPVSFNDLVEFGKEEADLATDPTFSPDVLKKERNKETKVDKENKRYQFSKRVPPRANTFYTSTTSSPKPPQYPGNRATASQCPSCQQNHSLDDCSEFKKKSVEDRVKFVMYNGLCFGCYGNNHRSKDCKSRHKCKECGKRHPTTLHQDYPTLNSQDKTGANSRQVTDQAVHVSNCANTWDTDSLDNHVINSMIVPVWLHHKDDPQHEVMVYALLDDASDTTFIRTSTLQALGINGAEIKLNLYTMHGKAEIPVQRIDGLVVKRLDKRVEISLPKTYSRDYIPSKRDQIPRSETASLWPHLKKIEDKIPPYQNGVDVALLIGCNCPKALKPREVILGKADDPYAIRTLLGWGILGPVTRLQDKSDGSEEVDGICHRIVTQEVGAPERVNNHFVVPTQTKEVLNPFEVKRMFELDFSEENVKKSAALSQDDRKFLGKVKESIRYDTDGHYEMALPLRDPDVKLPNNRNVALRRLSHLKRKLNIDSRYKEHYMAFMDKVLKSGYAEKVPPVSSQNPDHGSRLWYIPHHGVYHPKKPNKICVVFDCSAEFKGQSLNKHLLQGPDLTNNLTGVLCRFRKEPIAFMCDIESMFYQVKVTENCRNLLRFLWWEDGDKSKEPQEYRMTVHLFGATSSPGCSNFALKATADDNEIDVGSNPAEFLREDFYVDDGLKSVPSVEEAVKLIKDIKEMCKRGGFNLHKFTSNKKEVIDQIPVEDRAEGIKNLDLDHDALPVERALGVQWCIESDTFKFRITLKDRPCTRRGILSTVSSIFDPLGFVALLLLDGKIIVQELCKEGADWDDPVPEQVKSRWEQWRTELQVLEKFSIPRCYKPEDFGQVVGTELHHFSDASTKGYGQCSYLWQENDKGQVHCSFVIGKARVTPLKSVTVPRLELTAAVVSAKIGEQLRKELHIGEIDEVFWTDSKVVLGYIANNSKRFHIFVANRVQQIQDLTSIKQWRYVNTESNPADDASRGLTAHQLLKSRWSNGLEFLWKDKTQWPVETSTVKENQKNDPEVKKVVTMATITAVADDCLLNRLSIFSDWHRAKRALALYVFATWKNFADAQPAGNSRERRTRVLL